MEATTARSRRHDARCHAQLARLLAVAGKHARAVDHYERALEELAAASGEAAAIPRDSCDLKRRLQLDHSEIRAQLARSLVALKRHHDAVLVYESLLRDDPKDADAHVNLAAQLMVVGGEDRLRDAERHCARAISLRPSLPEAHYNMNVVMRRLGRQQEAVDLYWRYLERDHGLRRPGSSDNNSVSDQERSIAREPTPRVLTAKTSGSVAVLCVKWGSKYGSEYVNKLYRGVMRQCLRADETRLGVVCLTDDATGIHRYENLHCLRLEDGWKGWWNKCQVFAPHVSAKVSALGLRRCVYIDLDTVIVGDVSDLLISGCGDGLALLKTDEMANEQRRHGHNSSIMTWSSEDAPQLSVAVYQLLKEHFDAVSSYIYKFDHWLEVSTAFTSVRTLLVCLYSEVPHSLVFDHQFAT